VIQLAANKQHVYSSIDLFSGIGGIRLGFQEAFDPENKGLFTVKRACEISSQSRKTYKANFDTPVDIFEDITTTCVNKYCKADICMAGFPCQTFSKAGKREGFDDKRGILYKNVVQICRRWKPLVIFCENVKELSTRDKGNALKQIVEDLAMNGNYDVYHDVLNSKNFGVPQNRMRLYIVAFRKDLNIKQFDFPHNYGEPASIGKILEKGPVAERYYLSQRYLDTLKRHKKRQQARHNGFGYVVRNLDQIAGTLVCGGMGKERNLIYDNRCKPIKDSTNKEFIRAMTPTEWKRLQGFPEDFEFPVAITCQYTQLANSVTVSVIKAIAEQIKPILDAYWASKTGQI